jgi:hypothetical protein
MSVSVDQATSSGASTEKSLTRRKDQAPIRVSWFRLCDQDLSNYDWIRYPNFSDAKDGGMLSKGVGLFPTEPVEKIREYVQLSESLGYDHVWFGDSQNIWRESSTVMGAAAVGTEKIIFGTGVTNAVTRHPSLLASTWATLAEFTGGRVALGIGTGD